MANHLAALTPIVIILYILIHVAYSKSVSTLNPEDFQDVESQTFQTTTENVEVTPHIYPFQTALLIYKGNGNHFCGGSLISNQWILTAAHCIDMDPDNILVFLGAHDLPDTSSMVAYSSSEYIIHDDWDRETHQHDIALVKLPYNVTITDLVRPVKLASDPDTYIGASGTVIGWNRADMEERTSVMLEDNCTVIANEDCANTNTLYQQLIQPTHLCVTGYTDAKNYMVNSGGPLLVEGVQVGIISFGMDDPESFPIVFTRVADHYEWILENMTDEFGYADLISMATVSIILMCVFLLCVLQLARYKRILNIRKANLNRLPEKNGGKDVFYQILR